MLPQVGPVRTHLCGDSDHFFRQTSTRWHHFICTLKEFTLQVWERIKKLFQRESAETVFLKGLLLQDRINWEEHAERISHLLANTSPYSYQGYLLKQVMRRSKTVDVPNILEKTFSIIFQHSKLNFERVVSFFDPEKLVLEDVLEEVREIAECLPLEEKKMGLESGIKKTIKAFFRFFSGFMDTVLKAFNLLEAGKGPETIWDFAAMLEIYFKIFMIPHGVFVMVGAVVAITWKMILIATAIILAAVVGICLYLKFRPCPSRLPRARNLTEEAEQGKLEPVVAREKEIQTIVTYLGKKVDGILTNLVLVGEPGVGKTELVKGVAERCREKKIFALNAPELASGYNSIGDRLRLLFLDVRGHENKVVFFLDELGDAMKKSAADITGFLKPFLGQDGVQVIAAMTKDDYEEHFLKDKALTSRFHKIEVLPTDEAKTMQILQERMLVKGGDVRFEEDIDAYIYQQTKDELQPRSSVMLLDLAINRVRAFDIKEFVSDELFKARETLGVLRRNYKKALKSKSGERSEIAQRIREQKKVVVTLETRDTNTSRVAKLIKELIVKERYLLRLRDRLATRALSEAAASFLHGILLPWINRKVEEEIGDLSKEFPIFVDKPLIRQLR